MGCGLALGQFSGRPGVRKTVIVVSGAFGAKRETIAELSDTAHESSRLDLSDPDE